MATTRSNTLQTYQDAQNQAKQKLFATMQKEHFPNNVLSNFVSRALSGSSFNAHCTTAALFQFKQRFAKSLAFHNLWLLCWNTERRDLA